jgi:hypothetical protein
MKTKMRQLFILAASSIAIVGTASAGINGKMLEQMRERAENSQSAPQSAPARSAPQPQQQQSAATPAPSQWRGRERGPVADGQQRNRGSAPVADGQQRNRSGSVLRSENQGGVYGELLARNRGGNSGGREGSRDNRNGNYNNGNHDSGRRYDGNRGYNGNHGSRVVNSLPYGHRHYDWNGSRYYNYGGSWYRPYGSSFLSIGVPYGLFVSSLPGYFNSFWYGSSRYYYADDTYYTYEPARRGYVVARSPYGDDRGDDDYNDARDEDLFIYPARGQSEQQQADDRYECHRWAVKETGFDPIDSDYDSVRRADYQRAITACLTGRGYSVK